MSESSSPNGISAAPPWKSLAAWLCLLLPLILGLTLDLASKHLAFEAPPTGLVTGYTIEEGRPGVESIEARPIPNILHLHAHVNYGAVFGIGQGQRVIFVIVSALAIGLLGFLFARSGRQRLYQFLLGLLFAGVLGNLYDRIVFGYVRDMIYAFPNLHWSDLWKALPQMEVFPWIFNVADSMLCTGVGAMFLYTTFRKAPATTPTAPAEVATK
jgi:signal peptidase II